jgi:predicted aldo/keto reductase-like oxidoreductase
MEMDWLYLIQMVGILIVGAGMGMAGHALFGRENDYRAQLSMIAAMHHARSDGTCAACTECLHPCPTAKLSATRIVP